jgi:hypothetical protein
MGAAHPGWRRLGAVLVEAGLLSEHDLTETLADQERSGRRLGEILVARGLVSAAAVANALAEQHGSFLKTEHGFGTGLRALIGGSDAWESASPAPDPPPVSRIVPRQQFELYDRQDPPPAEPSPVPPLEAAVPDGSSDESPARAWEAEQQRETTPGHLLFVPTPHGYLLLQRDGDAPAIGETLELPGICDGGLTVAKLSPSPLPHDRRPCAYLHAL